MQCTWFLHDTYLSRGDAAPAYRTYNHQAYICPKCGSIWLRQVLDADRPWDCRARECPEHGIGTSLYLGEACSIWHMKELAAERGGPLLRHEFMRWYIRALPSQNEAPI